jgi:hypothetical protein
VAAGRGAGEWTGEARGIFTVQTVFSAVLEWWVPDTALVKTCRVLQYSQCDLMYANLRKNV